MREALHKQLEELRQLAEGRASERTLETRVVLILERLGWMATQIEQDVPLTPRGNDRADIVVRVGERHAVLVEVKRRGEMRGAEEQLRRYCQLLTPRPRLAFLTDGVRWSVFYASLNQVRELYTGEAMIDAEAIIDMLLIISPESLSETNLALRFDFLDVVEQGLSRLSSQEQSRLLPCYMTTISFLLGKELPMMATPVAVAVPVVAVVPTPPEARAREDTPPSDGELLILDVLNPPLRHSKMRGRVAGVDVTSWRTVVHVAVRHAVEAGMTGAEIRDLTSINLREEHFNEDGFAPVTGTSLSVQAMDANRSWTSAFSLIRRLNLPVEITVDWTEKANEDWRGKRGMLRWVPSGDKLASLP